MKVFIFNIEHYLSYEEESQNYLARLPLLHCGLKIEHRDHAHQRNLKTKGRHAAETIALQEVEEFRPDVVVYFQAWKDEDLSPDAFRRIRAMGIPIIGYIWDSNVYPRWNEMRLFENVDCLVVVSLDAYVRWRIVARMLDERKTVVFGHGLYYVPPPTKTSYEKVYDATLVGSIEAQRADLIPFLRTQLSQRGFKFLHAGGLVNEMDAKGEAKWLSWDQYDQVIRQSKLCISSQTARNRLGIKGKIFEAMARGTPCLVDNDSESVRFFPANVVTFYSSMENCLEQILYYLENEDERRALEARATAWFNSTFDSRQFYTNLLQYIVEGKGSPPYLPHIEPVVQSAWSERRSLLPIITDATTSMIEHIDRKGLLPHQRPI